VECEAASENSDRIADGMTLADISTARQWISKNTRGIEYAVHCQASRSSPLCSVSESCKLIRYSGNTLWATSSPEGGVGSVSRILCLGQCIADHGSRLRGPEARQECLRGDGTAYRCGEASINALRTLVGSELVGCEGYTFDRYKRLITVCCAGSINLNAEMVRLGWALAYRRYSKNYVQ
jgi:hypothetical protein